MEGEGCDGVVERIVGPGAEERVVANALIFDADSILVGEETDRLDS